ncbi:MAG: hypothetical protein ACM37V_06010, partial [Gemmatimonadota bacterium]
VREVTERVEAGAGDRLVDEQVMVMRQPNGLRDSGPKTWSWTHGTTRRRSDERVNIVPQTAL